MGLMGGGFTHVCRDFGEVFMWEEKNRWGEATGISVGNVIGKG